MGRCCRVSSVSGAAPASPAARALRGRDQLSTLTKKAHEPRGAQTPGVSLHPLLGRGMTDKKISKCLQRPDGTPRPGSGCGRPRRHSENQRKAAWELYEQPDSKGQETGCCYCTFFFFLIIFLEVLHPHHRLDSGTFAIAQPRAPLPSGHSGWGPGRVPAGPLFSLPHPRAGAERGARSVSGGSICLDFDTPFLLVNKPKWTEGGS